MAAAPKIANAGGMTTAEAASKIGISINVLRGWAREGWLTPASEGEGRQKRMTWTERDLQQARALMHQESGKSSAEATIDSLGGPLFLERLGQARAKLDRLRPDEVVFAGPKGVVVRRRDEIIRSAVDVVGEPAIMLAD